MTRSGNTYVRIEVFRFKGGLSELSRTARRELLDRLPSRDDAIALEVSEIIRQVRAQGDRALFEFAKKFDRVDLESLEVPRDERRRAIDRVPTNLRRALTRSADNIARVHRAFLPSSVEVEPEPGILVGRRPDPLARVGVYAPGGRALYPSSVLMGAVVARVAGVREVILCSPPSAESTCAPIVLLAAEIAEVDRVFAIGGAGAISAMAYGTESVPTVSCIVGPGNAYVAEAKLQVSLEVPIDAPAGPSELLVIADTKSDAAAVAREIVAQAEHDPDASVVALVLDAQKAERVIDEVARLAVTTPRAEIVQRALRSRGAVLTVDTLEEACAFANDFAAEHLLLALEDPDRALSRIRNTGTVFLGELASVAFGDYMTGANHVLPTGGLARRYSGLGVEHFFRWTTYQRVSRTAAAKLADDVSALAEAEGLFAHAAAASARREP